MSRRDVVELIGSRDLTAAGWSRQLREAMSQSPRPEWILVRSEDVEVDEEVARALVGAPGEPLAASWSPVPDPAIGRRAVAVRVHPSAPPAASIPQPCVELCAVSTEAILSVACAPGAGDGTWRDEAIATMQRLTDAGWRHLVRPGVGYGWSGATSPTRKAEGWSAASVRTMVDAQSSLEAHRLWLGTRVRPPGIVIDGACVSGDLHNGTQVVVLQLSRALAAVRPESHIALAVSRAHVGVASRLLRGSGVDVIERGRSLASQFDVAYRPYQAIDPSEFEWLRAAGRRVLLGQLDMIGYSNPSYHPSADLLHTVRNLQRHMMRVADAVTFISDFGRTTARSECPEIPAERLHVVGCGVDVDPHEAHDVVPPTAATSFVACLSATFHHKNRTHAIRTFASMCERHGYAGSLVIAGPEPFYGRSDDDALIAALPHDVARRIERLGHVDVATKWWLLRRADLVLYPSVVEGFGLVPFEASAVGTPSLSYDGTGLHEVLEVAEALVGTWDVDVWADRAAELVDDSTRRASAVARVNAAGHRHRWADVAVRTWDVIDATIALPSVSPPEEGSAWARVGRARRPTRRLAPARHFAVRVAAALRRRATGAADRWRRRR